MLMNSFLAMTISLIFIFINSIMGKKMFYEREKLSPFECGFDPKSSPRIPFSIQFYMIALIFLIFDIEITLIIPIPLCMNMMNYIYWSMLVTLLLIVLLVGLIHEWNEGALNWKI
uniref:NADH-ubiquinone oxidoreductase chain 3 n=1 Tax=Novacerus sp. FZ-2019 TaxID=2585224 RepID=A0A6H0EYM5_9HEXA|nr:NADH dehydrogenase subunit 3 [Novacerus sp. FZ-2019]